MKFLLDMNLSPKIGVHLQKAGIDAIHWRDLGDTTARDGDIAAHAAATGMIVVTHDLDFGALLASSRNRAPSVIQIRADDLSVEEIGEKLVSVVRDLDEELRSGVLVTLDAIKVRVRILPIRPQ